MKCIFAFCFSVAVLAGHSTFAQGVPDRCTCDPIVVMIGDDRKSDVICPGSQTRDALLQTWGPSRPQGSKIIVIRKSTGMATWAPEGSTPEGLAREAGSEPRFTGSAEERVACFSASATQICPAPQRNSLGRIQPKSGLWQSHLGDTAISGCPAQIASALAAAAPAGLGSGQERRRFSDPFHPSDLLPGTGMGDATWTELPEGGWTVEFVPRIISQQQAAGASTSVTMSLQVACDTAIEGQTLIALELPDIARGLLGVGAGGCRITRPFQMRWIGE